VPQRQVEKNSPMKSKKNLTRYTYETTAFQGWRMCVCRAGTTFTKYFSDKDYGGGRKSLETAEGALAHLKEILGESRRVNGKLSQSTVKKAEKFLFFGDI
jgi:hypothetical protein